LGEDDHSSSMPEEAELAVAEVQVEY